MNKEAFSALTQAEQVARIQRLGSKALDAFQVRPSKVEPLVHFENSTYYVESPEGRFCMRVCRPGMQTIGSLNSEILFLSALAEAGFSVPNPYQNRVVTVGHPDVPEERHVVLFDWMDGEFLKGSMNPDVSRKIGRVMAGLQTFARNWEPPLGFIRDTLHGWTSEPTTESAFDREVPGISEGDRRFLTQQELGAKELFRSMTPSPDNFCLTHADLLVGNILIEDGALHVIDFDDCGYAFRMYDFAAALAYHVLDSDYPGTRDAMLLGFQEVADLPPDALELLDPFIRMRLVGVSQWVLSRIDNPQLREVGAQWVARFCEMMRGMPSTI
jgi:Ser/Thr protein kinase RdoA (MazF antagonist)